MGSIFALTAVVIALLCLFGSVFDKIVTLKLECNPRPKEERWRDDAETRTKQQEPASIPDTSPSLQISLIPFTGSDMDTKTRVFCSGPYIECISAYAGGAVWGSVLHDSDLIEIGEFTRGNIERWLASYGGPCIECCGVQDFHAVCGEIDIPWREEINAQEYKRLNPPLAAARWR